MSLRWQLYSAFCFWLGFGLLVCSWRRREKQPILKSLNDFHPQFRRNHFECLLWEMLFNSYDFLFCSLALKPPRSSCLKNTWQHNCIRESLQMIKGNFHRNLRERNGKNLNFMLSRIENPFHRTWDRDTRQRFVYPKIHFDVCTR